MRILFQFNLVTMRTPFDDPFLDDFRAWIPALHALAQVHPGFVWRYEGEKGDDGYIKPYPDAPLIMGNMSAWKDYHSLYDYTFSSSHLEMMKHKRKWFKKMSIPYAVLYYGVAGDLTKPPLELLEEAKRCLSYLSVYGETPVAFNFGSHNGVL